MINFSKLPGRIGASGFLLLLVLAGSVGCVSTDPWAAYEDLDPEGNIFVQGYGNQRPRYGHGGTESPSARKAREEQERRAAARAERDRKEAQRREELRTEAERMTTNPERSEITPPDSLADDKPELPAGIDEITPVEEPEVKPAPEPAAPPAPVPTMETLAYGRPVPGKPGMVYSPYSPDAGYVDVTGIAPGTKVKCPYTKKLFRVP
ncbi:MAG: hypothetical protein KDN22_15170 [Verrucomicrobiae bacterium]|nr:hypothetical protein [Verrucomicrobiae bacterium]